MDEEIERLFMEYIPGRRGKLTTAKLKCMLGMLGVRLAVKHIRGLLFRYDSSKSKDLDLDEFRQLVYDIISSSDYLDLKKSDEVEIRNADESNVASEMSYLSKTPVPDSADIITIRTNNKTGCKEEEAQTNNSMFHDLVKLFDFDDVQASDVAFRLHEKLIDAMKPNAHAQETVSLVKDSGKGNFKRSHTLPRKFKYRTKRIESKERVVVENNNSVLSRTVRVCMYGEDVDLSKHLNTDSSPIISSERHFTNKYFNRNSLRRKSHNNNHDEHSIKKRIDIEMQSTIHTYTLPRKSSTRFKLSPLKYTVSLSREYTFRTRRSRVITDNTPLTLPRNNAIKESVETNTEDNSSIITSDSSEASTLPECRLEQYIGNALLPVINGRNNRFSMGDYRSRSLGREPKCRVNGRLSRPLTFMTGDSFLKELRDRLGKQEEQITT